MRKIIIDNRVKERGKSGIPLFAERILGLHIDGHCIYESAKMSMPGKLGILFELLPNLSCELDRTADVILHVNNNIPFIINPFKHRIVVIHDLGPILHPNFYSLQARLIFRLGLFFALRYSWKILVISNTVKYDFDKLFPKFAVKAIVSYPFLSDDEVNEIGDFDSRPLKYFVIFAGSSERKNVNRFLNELNSVVDTDCDFSIIVIGRLNIKNLSNLDLDIFENVPNEKLNSLLYNSTGLLFPSIYEGFGAPLVHAISYSKFILCGNTEINKEVLNDYKNVYYHDIFDFKDIKLVYQKLLETYIEEKKPVKIPKKFTKLAFEKKILAFL